MRSLGLAFFDFFFNVSSWLVRRNIWRCQVDLGSQLLDGFSDHFLRLLAVHCIPYLTGYFPGHVFLKTGIFNQDFLIISLTVLSLEPFMLLIPIYLSGLKLKFWDMEPNQKWKVYRCLIYEYLCKKCRCQSFLVTGITLWHGSLLPHTLNYFIMKNCIGKKKEIQNWHLGLIDRNVKAGEKKKYVRSPKRMYGLLYFPRNRVK